MIEKENVIKDSNAEMVYDEKEVMNVIMVNLRSLTQEKG
jgi:hypothetical protein